VNKQKITTKYIIYDLIAAIAVWVLFTIFRRAVNDAQLFPNVQIFFPKYDYYSSLIIYPLISIFIHYITGFYLQPHKHSIINTIVSTLTSASIISFAIFFALLLDDIVVSYRYYYYSIFVLFGLQFGITAILRILINNDTEQHYKQKKWQLNTLIVGTGANALKVATDLQKNSYKNTVCGFVEVNHSATTVYKEKILGNFQQIDNIIATCQADEVIIALENPDELQLFHYINALFRHNIEIKFTPRLYEILTGSARIGKMGFQPLVSLTEIHMPDWQIAVKRLFDVVVSFLMIIMLIPAFIYFAVIIKKDSKGPVFYWQERIGRNGKPFQILKFRTMYTSSENGTPKLSSPNDSRITNIGRILRKYRLDELPQFWNVIKGEMSIVGPRPERKYYINQIIEQAPYYCLLYKIRPGLTSWGPIKIGYSDTIEKMIERLNFDIIYMENMSIVNDIRIMVLTVEILFNGKGM